MSPGRCHFKFMVCVGPVKSFPKTKPNTTRGGPINLRTCCEYNDRHRMTDDRLTNQRDTPRSLHVTSRRYHTCLPIQKNFGYISTVQHCQLTCCDLNFTNSPPCRTPRLFEHINPNNPHPSSDIRRIRRPIRRWYIFAGYVKFTGTIRSYEPRKSVDAQLLVFEGDVPFDLGGVDVGGRRKGAEEC